jgi:hypothetical protein
MFWSTNKRPLKSKSLLVVRSFKTIVFNQFRSIILWYFSYSKFEILNIFCISWTKELLYQSVWSLLKIDHRSWLSLRFWWHEPKDSLSLSSNFRILVDQSIVDQCTSKRIVINNHSNNSLLGRLPWIPVVLKCIETDVMRRSIEKPRWSRYVTMINSIDRW